MMISRTSCVYVRSPLLRVMMSHFSGVVMISCVSLIYALLPLSAGTSSLVRFTSPDSSRTFTPYGFSFYGSRPRHARTRPKLSTISFTSAFMGATYTILNLSRSTLPYDSPTATTPTSSRRCSHIS